MIENYLSDFVKNAYKIDEFIKYELETVEAVKLLNANRLDIIAKIIYLIEKDRCFDYAKSLYLEHIRVMTKDSFIEAGSNKQGKQAFIDAFEKLFEDLKTNGYDLNSLPVPVDRNYHIMDGAHRVAACFILNIPVRIIKLDLEAIYDKYDYLYFRDRLMNEDYLDQIVLKYIEIKKNIACINIWPSAKGNDESLKSLINDVVYYKEVKLNENGAFNYLAQIYKEYSWAQNSGDGFSGVYRKLVPCFPTFDPVRVYFVETDNFDRILTLKEKIRDIYKIEKHSVHATDNIKETIEMARILLSRNSIEFMNKCNSTKFKSTFEILNDTSNYDLENTVFTGSIVLALYGIREANDLDFIDINNSKDSHNDYLDIYKLSLNDVIYNPNNYFIYFNIKFLKLEIIKQFKENRNEGKDKDDLKLIEMILANSDKKNIKVTLLQTKRRVIAKAQGVILKIAHKTGTYDLLRSIYKRIKK